jgi:hypothetical protein
LIVGRAMCGWIPGLGMWKNEGPARRYALL